MHPERRWFLAYFVISCLPILFMAYFAWKGHPMIWIGVGLFLIPATLLGLGVFTWPDSRFEAREQRDRAWRQAHPVLNACLLVCGLAAFAWHVVADLIKWFAPQ
ncbi:MAG: hypothetical protein QM755_07190 [Luteolibacter sp.]